nr:hypothetical protein [uncultured bacterium]
MMDYGTCEGDTCKRRGCKGVIETHPVENCSCHIAPPCSACTAPRNYCPVCDWEEADDVVINDYVVNVDKNTGNYRVWTQRPLDATKIDWHNKLHSNASMIKEGVYPEGTTMAQVEEMVRGTFGGRFEQFGCGKFKYIAYTD